jgi:hypothetical protein
MLMPMRLSDQVSGVSLLGLLNSGSALEIDAGFRFAVVVSSDGASTLTSRLLVSTRCTRLGGGPRQSAAVTQIGPLPNSMYEHVGFAERVLTLVARGRRWSRH